MYIIHNKREIRLSSSKFVFEKKILSWIASFHFHSELFPQNLSLTAAKLSFLLQNNVAPDNQIFFAESRSRFFQIFAYEFTSSFIIFFIIDLICTIYIDKYCNTRNNIKKKLCLW